MESEQKVEITISNEAQVGKYFFIAERVQYCRRVTNLIFILYGHSQKWEIRNIGDVATPARYFRESMCTCSS